MPGLMTIKKETFFRIHGFDEQLSGYEDDDLFLRIFEIGKIKYLPISTLQCRLHPNNFSQSAEMVQNRFTYYQKLIRHYTHQGTDLRRVQYISWRFFKLFLVQAMNQYRKKNVLFLENFATAREIVPEIPLFKKVLFNPFFLFEDRKAIKWLSGVYFNQRKTKETRVF
jgi:GT2 family glycosyltransferase